MQRFVITKKQLERFGESSLEGALLKAGMFDPSKPLILAFEQSTSDWKEENGGPDEIILPEHVPMVLCRSILSMAERGFDIRIEEHSD